MFDTEIVLNEFMVRYLSLVVADIAEAEMGEQPVAGFNPPRWILGHLAISTDLALRVGGRRFRCPKDWHRSFRRGSPATGSVAVTATKEQFLDAVTSGFAAACWRRWPTWPAPWRSALRSTAGCRSPRPISTSATSSRPSRAWRRGPAWSGSPAAARSSNAGSSHAESWPASRPPTSRSGAGSMAEPPSENAATLPCCRDGVA